MAKLPKNIIKKYGISKKAWAVFKGKGGKTMAKRRKGFKRSKSRKVFGGSSGINLIQVDSMLYGVARPYVSGVIGNFTSGFNLPSGVMLGVANWLIAKNTSGLIRNVAVKGLVYENANFASSLLGGSTTTNNSSLWTGGY